MGRVGGGKWRGGMGIGDDEEAGTYGFGGHDWGFEGSGRERNVEGGTLGMCYSECTYRERRADMPDHLLPMIGASRRKLIKRALVEQAETLLW